MGLAESLEVVRDVLKNDTFDVSNYRYFFRGLKELISSAQGILGFRFGIWCVSISQC